jgi:hypothetical protein
MPRSRDHAGEIRVSVGAYTLTCVPDGLPAIFNEVNAHATLCEQFDMTSPNLCCIAVARAPATWPFLVVAQSFSPAGGGFEPGVLIVPERHRLFIGAGERLIAYDLSVPRRLWIDSVDTGFWGWQQHGAVVVMSAELELAAWPVDGEKLWSTFVEPPWTYSVEGDVLTLDVMGKVTSFSLTKGPMGTSR